MLHNIMVRNFFPKMTCVWKMTVVRTNLQEEKELKFLSEFVGENQHVVFSRLSDYLHTRSVTTTHRSTIFLGPSKLLKTEEQKVRDST